MHRKERKQARRRGKRQTHRFSAPPQLEPGALTDLELMRAIQAEEPDAWVHNATEEEIVLGDTRVLIRKVINGLPPAQQQAIDLAFFRGMSQREIAAKTNTPLGTVKTRLELGLKKIYDGLKELKDEL